MCGICGVFDLSGVSPKKLRKMNDTGAHRGPDGWGITLFDGVGEHLVLDDADRVDEDSGFVLGFGHRRLSIIDLTDRAKQPMFDNSGRYCIVYNGEIYNYVELRKELQIEGYRFRSSGDTEVILAAYNRWGINCHTRFNGMWSFAIYDRIEKTLFCSRDRFGIKPFYYYLSDGKFVFASEIKQILEYQSTSHSLRDDVLAEMIFWGCETHNENTFFSDIYRLPPSHYLLIKLVSQSTLKAEPIKYWSYELDKPGSPESSTDDFRDLFLDSVRLRLRSDVPVGVSLSGGLDSSSVASVMHKLLGERDFPYTPKMFTCSYEQKGYSERKYSDSVVEKTGFNPYLITPESSDLRDNWDDFIWHMEEPFQGLSYFSNYMLMKKVRQENVKVILNGQGGDELLLGYERYRVAFNRLLFRHGKWLQLGKELAAGMTRSGISPIRQLMYQVYFSSTLLRRIRRERIVKQFLRPDFFNKYRANTESIKDSTRYDALIELQEKEFFKYQLQHLLRHEDCVSMASSVEVRLPFMDYRLYNFILSQDDDVRINAGWSKAILRKAMSGIIPDIVRDRVDKMGYETPIYDLFRQNDGFFTELLDEKISDDYVDVNAVKHGFKNGSINHNLLCTILTYLGWRRRFNV